MKTKIILIVIFILMVLAQWYIPLKMIKGSEDILLTGTEFMFRTAPVDPYDAFRGKYVQLNFRDNIYTTPDSTYQYKEMVYVSVEKGTDGFTTIKSVSKKEPIDSDNYIKASISSFYKTNNNVFEMRIQYPFDRYYMDEFKAPKADSLYNKSTQDTLQTVYAIVAVKRGEAVLKEVKIGEVSLVDYFKNH